MNEYDEQFLDTDQPTDTLDLCMLMDNIKTYLFADSVTLSITKDDDFVLTVSTNGVDARFLITDEIMCHSTIQELIEEFAFCLSENNYHIQSSMVH